MNRLTPATKVYLFRESGGGHGLHEGTDTMEEHGDELNHLDDAEEDD